MSFPIPVGTATEAMNLGFPGPFSIGANLYVVLFDSILNTLVMSKSTDNGNTWAVVGGAGPSDFLGTYAYAAVQVGTKIWAVNVDKTTKHQQLTAFDTVSGTWGAATVTTNVPGSLSHGAAPISIYYNSTSALLVIAGNASATTVWNASYFTFDPVGLTYSAWTQFGPVTIYDTLVGGQMYDTGGGSQFIFAVYDHNSVNQVKTLYRQGLSSSNVLGSVVLIDTVTDSSSLVPYLLKCFGNGTGSPSNTIIAWQPSNAAPASVNIYTAVAGTWTFTKQVITAPTDTGVFGTGCTIGLDYPYAYLLTSTLKNLYQWQDSGGAGVYTLLGQTPGISGQSELWMVPQAVAGYLSIFGSSYVVPG